MPIFRHALPLFTAAALTGSAVAQEVVQILPAPAEGVGAESFYGADSNQGVYVRDSAVALEKFPLVARLERQKEWGKAADLLQEVLETYPDRVIQVATNDAGQITRYTSVANAVQQQIARWPADGLAAYRARFEAPAQAMLAGAADVPALRRVYSAYFNTAPGLEAGMRLIDLSFRAGDFRAAADISAELLAWHPLAEASRPGILFRAALMHHLAGDAEKAVSYHEQLQTNYPDAQAPIAGASQPLVATLAEALQQAPADARDLSPDHWPLLGGDATRSRVSSAEGRPGARLFRIPLSGRIVPNINPEMRLQLETQDAHARSEGSFLGVIPVTDRAELFFQDGKRIYGVSLESGTPLSGWAETYAGDAAGAYVDPDTTPLPAGQQLTITVTDNEVLAIMGMPERQSPFAGSRPDNAVSRIVCLDRRSGRLKWMVRPSDLPDDGGSLRSLVFSGSPLVVGDSVHFIGRGGKSNQFEDAYVITVGLADGRHKWSTYIASANSENMNFWGDRGGAATLSPEGTSHLAHASGKLFVLTNLGATAALDAYSGNIRWLSIYPRNVTTDPRAMRRSTRMQSVDLPRPWTYNPVVVRDGRVFVLPNDSDELLIYDASSGEQVKSIRASHLGTPDTLVGVVGDRLITAAEYRISCINWQTYDAKAFAGDARDKAIYWISTFPEDVNEDDLNPIRGRSFLTTDSVFVPTRKGLFRLLLRNGARVEQYPSEEQGGWAEDEGGGNVLVTADRVVIAGDSAVNVYTDLRLARAKLDAEVAAAPDAPAPRLRYAEVMFVAGETELALAKLDEAMQLLGGAGSLRPGHERDRLFTAALSFAEKAAAVPSAPADQFARQLYDRAAQAAASPAHQVNYRLSRARFAASRDELPAVVRLYQEILLDPALRRITLSDARAGGATAAAVVAEREIAALIAQSGRAVYKPYDDAAAVAMGAAVDQGEPQRLIDLANQYPNATTAPHALLAAARLYESAADHRRATQTLRQIEFKYGESFDRAVVVEAMARNYLARSRNVDVALSRLKYGARIAGNPPLAQPLTLPDGKVIAAGTTFAEAARILGDHRAEAVATTAPDFRLPAADWPRGQSPFAAERPPAIGDISALITPHPQHARHDRIIAFSPHQGVVLLDVGSRDPRGTAPTITEAPTAAAWTGAGLLLQSPSQLALLDPDTAEPRWIVRLDALPDAGLLQQPSQQRSIAPPVVAQAEPVVVRGRLRIVNNRAVPQPVLAAPQPMDGPERFLQLALTGDRAIATTSTGRLIALDLASGKLAWQTRLLPGLPLDRLIANDDFAVVRIVDEQAVQLVVLDTLNGEMLSRRRFNADSPQVPVNFALAGDGTLVYLLPDRLCGKDLYEPGDQLNWEVPAPAPGSRLFMGATRPDHLQIDGNRIIVLSDEGQFVRLHALEDGKLLRWGERRGNRAPNEALLGTESQGWETRLLLDDSHLYVISNKAILGYNLEQQQSWSGTIDTTLAHNFRHAVAGRGYLVAFESLAQGEAAGTTYRLHAFSRARVNGHESGLLVHSPEVRDPAGIEAWIGVDGGFYYLAGNHMLHFLPSAQQPAQQPQP